MAGACSRSRDTHWLEPGTHSNVPYEGESRPYLHDQSGEGSSDHRVRRPCPSLSVLFRREAGKVFWRDELAAVGPSCDDLPSDNPSRNEWLDLWCISSRKRVARQFIQ